MLSPIDAMFEIKFGGGVVVVVGLVVALVGEVVVFSAVTLRITTNTAKSNSNFIAAFFIAREVEGIFNCFLFVLLDHVKISSLN